MRRKYLCVLMAGLIISSTAGCKADSSNDDGNSVSGNDIKETTVEETGESIDDGTSGSEESTGEENEEKTSSSSWSWAFGNMQDPNNYEVSDYIDYCLYEDNDITIDYMYTSYAYGDGLNLIEEFGLDDIDLVYGLGYMDPEETYSFDRFIFISISSKATIYGDLYFTEFYINGNEVPVTSHITLSPESTIQIAVRCQVEDMNYFDDVISLGAVGKITVEEDGEEISVKNFNFLGKRVSNADLISTSDNDKE